MTSQKENGFTNILINIIIPVLILNKGAKYGLSPTQALLLALLFPLGNGIYSLVQEKRINFISLLGLMNILLSGVLTLLALDGIWFAVKEAIFPLLIGVFVWFSSFSKKPFFESMFINPALFDIEKLESRLDTEEKKSQFKNLLIKSTQYFSFSFLLSAALNFGLALYIFRPLDTNLGVEEKQNLLNQQLSQNTLYSLVVIMIPSLIFIGIIMYNAITKTKIITGLSMEDLMKKT
jgi:hypothetical protein